VLVVLPQRVLEFEGALVELLRHWGCFSLPKIQPFIFFVSSTNESPLVC
jgi:hypothetical protein